jgi:hypothetical protein
MRDSPPEEEGIRVRKTEWMQFHALHTYVCPGIFTTE